MKILNFSAVWCHGCLLMKSIVAEIQKEYPDLEIIEYDLDDDLEAVNKWKIGDKIPVYIFDGDLEIDLKEVFA